jgi:hypothetical protein
LPSAWTFFRGVVAGYGLGFEVLSEPDPVAWANVAFLAGFRHRGRFDGSILDALPEVLEPGGVRLAVLEPGLEQPRHRPVRSKRRPIRNPATGAVRFVREHSRAAVGDACRSLRRNDAIFTAALSNKTLTFLQHWPATIMPSTAGRRGGRAKGEFTGEALAKTRE